MKITNTTVYIALTLFGVVFLAIFVHACTIDIHPIGCVLILFCAILNFILIPAIADSERIKPFVITAIVCSSFFAVSCCEKLSMTYTVSEEVEISKRMREISGLYRKSECKPKVSIGNLSVTIQEVLETKLIALEKGFCRLKIVSRETDGTLIIVSESGEEYGLNLKQTAK